MNNPVNSAAMKDARPVKPKNATVVGGKILSANKPGAMVPVRKIEYVSNQPPNEISSTRTHMWRFMGRRSSRAVISAAGVTTSVELMVCLPSRRGFPRYRFLVDRLLV